MEFGKKEVVKIQTILPTNHEKNGGKWIDTVDLTSANQCCTNCNTKGHNS